MPIIRERHFSSGDVTRLTTDIAGAADDAVDAVRSDTLANLAADADANFADLVAKVNAILDALDAAGSTA